VSGAVDLLRRHPRHLVLGALVAGMLGAPLGARAIVLLATLALVLAGRPVLGGLAALALIVGAVGAHARVAALDRSELRPLLGSTVAARVVLLEQPRPLRYGAAALAELAAGPGERVMLRIREAVRWPRTATGALVLVHGRLRRLGPFESFYALRGAHAAISLDAAAATGQRRGGFAGMVDDVRGRAESALRRGLPPAQAALVRGMVLGQDQALDARTRQEFQAAGLSHILAASGENVALLLALGLPLLAWSGFGLRGRLVGALLLIALYVPLAGGGPSIQRAGAMGAATTVAALAGRPASRWYALLLAAAVTLAVNPRAAADPGWQLSFAAVVAIALLAPVVRARLRARRVPGGLADAAAVTFAATLGTAPLIAFHFSQLSLVSLPANLLAAPAIAPIMWLGFLSAALGQIAAPLALPLNALNAPLLGYVGWVAHTAARLPHASVPLALHDARALAGVYAALAALAWRLFLRRRPI
jgi:competence protein ComEC